MATLRNYLIYSILYHFLVICGYAGCFYGRVGKYAGNMREVLNTF